MKDSGGTGNSSARNMAAIIGQELKTEEETEEIDMCKAWDDWREEGCRNTKLEALRNMIAKLQLTASQAMDVLEITENEKETFLTLLQTEF